MAFLDRNEIVRSLAGAWQVFLDRPNAVGYFDVSVGGFWRSFRAIVLILPAYALSGLAEWVATPPEAGVDGTLFILGKAMSLAVDWVAFPIVLALIADRLKVMQTFSAYIIVRNWASVVATAPFGVIAFFYASDMIGQDAASTLSLAVLFVILRYNYLIARRVLQVGVGLAVAIVISDFVLSLAIDAGVTSLFGLAVQ